MTRLAEPRYPHAGDRRAATLTAELRIFVATEADVLPEYEAEALAEAATTLDRLAASGVLRRRCAACGSVLTSPQSPYAVDCTDCTTEGE